MRKLFDTVKNSIVSGNSFVFIFCFIILASFLTYVIPAGAYDRVVNEAGQEVILEGSFHRVPSSPVNPMRMFQCAPPMTPTVPIAKPITGATTPPPATAVIIRPEI